MTNEKKTSTRYTMPENIDEYKILEQIGAGGMGAVYKAIDTRLQRTVAIKVILCTKVNEVMLKRFYREIEVSIPFNHPNIVHIFGIGNYNNLPYIVMEYIDGLPLLYHFSKNALSLNEKMAMVIKIADALDYAHSMNVIHRDVKPSNIMVRSDGEPVLMDFGLAKTMELSDETLTKTGEIIGTPQYMAPEQAKGLKREIDKTSDVYSLGAVLYHILTGNSPNSGQNVVEIIHAVVKKRTVPPSSIKSEIPNSISNIALKALEKKKSNRYASAKLLAEDIQRYLDNKPVYADAFFRKKRILKSTAWVSFVGFTILLVVAVCMEYASMKEMEKSLQDQRQKLASLDPQKELARLDASIQKNPKDSDKYFQRALILYRLKRLPQALQDISQAMELTPCMQYYFLRGKWLYEAKLFKDAQESLSLALKAYLQKPKEEIGNVADIPVELKEIDQEKIESLLGETLEKYEKHEEACQHYMNAYARQPTKELELKIARTSYHCQKHESALKYLNSLISSETSNSLLGEALYYRGKIWESLNKTDEAEKDWQKAIQTDTSKHTDILFPLGRIYLERKEYKKAEEFLKKASEAFSENVSIHALLGQCLMETKQWENAAIAYSQCIDLVPWEYQYYFSRASCYTELKQFSKAEEDYSKCLRLNPEDFTPCIRIMDNMQTEGFMLNYSRIRVLVYTAITHAFIAAQYDLFYQEKMQLQKLLSTHLTLQTKSQPWDQKKFEIYFKSLLESSSHLGYTLSQSALLNMYEDPRLYDALQDVYPTLHQTELQERVQETMKKVIECHLPQFRQYLVRFYFIRDSEAIRIIYNKKDLGLQCLSAMLRDEEENVIIRFWSAMALANLYTAEADELLEQGSHLIGIAGIFSNLALFQGRLKTRPYENFTSSISHPNAYVRAITALYTPLEHQSVLEKFLQDKDIRVRLYAAKRLYFQGNENAEIELRKAMKDPDPSVRGFALYVYWNFDQLQAQAKNLIGKVRQHIPVLLEASGDANPQVARIALIRIAQIGGKELNYIFEKHLQNPDISLRTQALFFLAKNADFSKIMPILLDTKESSTLRLFLVVAAYRTLGNLPLFQKLQLFQKVLGDSDLKIKLMIFARIGTMDISIVEPLFLKYSHDKEESTRVASIIGMWMCKNPRFVPRLYEMLQDESTSVRSFAASTIVSTIGSREDFRKLGEIYREWVNGAEYLKQGAATGYDDIVYTYTALEGEFYAKMESRQSPGYPPLSLLGRESREFEFVWDWNEIYIDYIDNMLMYSRTFPWKHPDDKDWKRPRSLEEFIQLLSYSLELVPERNNVWFERGLFYYLVAEKVPDQKKKWYKKSISDLQKAVELNKKCYLFQRWLAYLYLLDGQYEKSTEIILRLISISPWDSQVWKWYGYILKEKGKSQEALACQKRAAYLDARFPK